MSEKNGHDPLTAQMVEMLGTILGRLDTMQKDVAAIREDIAVTREDVAELRAGQTSLGNEMSGLRVELRADLDEMRSNHEARIVRLEEAALKRTA